MIDRVHFSDPITRSQKKRGFSQKELAEILHITPRAYQYYEQGKREAPYDRLIAIAQELDVSIDYLLGLKDDPK